MATYFTIHDKMNPGSANGRLVAICHSERQAFDCYKRILNTGMGMNYIVLERVDTNNIGLVVGRIVLAEDWVRFENY